VVGDSQRKGGEDAAGGILQFGESHGLPNGGDAAIRLS
jgi:hypothetical protein